MTREKGHLLIEANQLQVVARLHQPEGHRITHWAQTSKLEVEGWLVLQGRRSTVGFRLILPLFVVHFLKA